MPNVLRLRRSNAPEPNRNSEAIYADAAGVLKQVAPDGSETSFGGEDGGSQSLEWVRFPFAYNTAGLIIPASGPAGVKVCDLAVGDLVPGTDFTGAWWGMIMVPTAFDHMTTDIGLWITTDSQRGNMPGTPPTGGFGGGTGIIDNADSPVPNGASELVSNLKVLEPNQGWIRCVTATGLWLYVDDGANGDPGATHGAAEFILPILRAA